MNDQFLKELGDLARQRDGAERSRLDERWDRLVAGTLTAEEDAELKALAETSPEARDAYEAFRPLGNDFQARMVSAINVERAGQASDGMLAALPEPRPPRVLPFHRAAFRRIEVWVGTATVVAAGLLFLVRSPALPPLPGYAATVMPGVQFTRGVPSSANGVQIFVPGSTLEIHVKPAHPVSEPVEAHAFVGPSGGGGRIVPLEGKEPEVADTGTGAVALLGTLGQEIRLRPGSWRIWIVVGRRGKLPSRNEILDALRAGRARGADWQAVPTDVRIEDRVPP